MPYSVSPHWNLTQLPAADIEAQIELLAFHAAQLGDGEMPQLVHENHEAQADGHLQTGGNPAAMRQPTSPPSNANPTQYLLRAQRRASSRLLERRVGVKFMMFHYAGQAGTIFINGARRRGIRPTAASLAAFSTAPAVPPARAASIPVAKPPESAPGRAARSFNCSTRASPAVAQRPAGAPG